MNKEKKTDTPNPEPLPFAQFGSIVEAPKHLQRLSDVLLNVDQINRICRRAYELGEDRSIDDTENAKGGTFRVENLRAAREEFQLEHSIEANQWVPNTNQIKAVN